MKRIGSTLSTLVLLAGCVAGAPTATTPSSARASATASSATAATNGPATAAPEPARPLPDYTGPQPLPAPDGQAMLWPTMSTVSTYIGWTDKARRYGFVDETGRRVLPEVYAHYEYCRDAPGRVSHVLGARPGRRIEVLNLQGAVIARAPTRDGSCGPPGWIVVTEPIDEVTWNQGVLDLRTGALVVPLARNRRVSVLSDEVVDVSGPQGSYFLRRSTGKRTAHPGFVGADLAAPGDAIPASNRPPDSDEPGQWGYLRLDGTWALTPRFARADPFRDGRAVVQRGEDRYELLDERFRPVRGPWTGLTQLTDTRERVVGYLASTDEGQTLLGGDLRVIVPAGPAAIACTAEATCSVRQPDGSASLVTLPDGAMTPLPPGFTQVLSPSFATDAQSADEPAARRVLLLATQQIVPLADWSSCETVGRAWVRCSPTSQALPTVLVDGQGRRSAISTIDAVPGAIEAAAPSYFWVTAGEYQGLIDDGGAWKFRESRYLRVEE